jgi:hypothetical protein
MKKGVPWFWALCLGLFYVALPHAARAGEFCPARISKVESVPGAPAAYAVQLETDSQRKVTGQFLLETDSGWYRAPFAPIAMQKAARGFDTPLVYFVLPKAALLRNVWLAQAASDDPMWGPRGIVNCSPDPERHTPDGNAPKDALAKMIAAQPIAAPFSYDCKTPFAHAVVDPGTIYAADAYSGDDVAVEVDLDATGRVVDTASIAASNVDFNARKRFEDAVRHMRFAPAIAYCKPVPSIYILHEIGTP